MSVRKYNLLIGLMLFWGFFVNAVTCALFKDVFLNMNVLLLITGYLVSIIAGICMSVYSDNSVISFIGYNLVVLPMGAVLSVVLNGYDVDIVLKTSISTASVTLLMMFVSMIYRDFFMSLGRTLFTCLVGVVIIEFLMILFGLGTPKWWDFLIALIFCGYIGHDWCDAQSKYRSVDNAVDSVVELYLDVVNMFVRILDILDKD